MVIPVVKKRAEKLLKGPEELIRFREAKHEDRPTVKPRGNVVCGELIEIGICPTKSYEWTNGTNFNKDAKDVLKRRRDMDYSDFNQFKKDISEIALMEEIELEDGLGKTEIFCNCFGVKGGHGCKGDICVHVCARYCNVLYCTVLYCTVL